MINAWSKVCLNILIKQNFLFSSLFFFFFQWAGSPGDIVAQEIDSSVVEIQSPATRGNTHFLMYLPRNAGGENMSKEIACLSYKRLTVLDNSVAGSKSLINLSNCGWISLLGVLGNHINLDSLLRNVPDFFGNK